MKKNNNTNTNTNNKSLNRFNGLNSFSSFNNRFNRFRKKPSIVQLVVATLYLGAHFTSIDAFPQQGTFVNQQHPNPSQKHPIANGTRAISTSSVISKSSLNSNSSNGDSSIETNPSSQSVQTQKQQQQQLYEQQRQKQQPKPIPITVLSGFLGSGKTTLLQHLLHNNQGLKIAVIVNDVASVNIDNKLLAVSGNYPRSGSGGDDDNNGGKAASIVQLSNGCACCSLSGELISSVSELVTLSDLNAHSIHNDDDDDVNGGGFDHIVIEASGVSEPRAIRSNFQDALYYGMPLMERVRLDTMVTVLDCSTFLDYMDSGRRLDPREVPELFGDSNPMKDDDDDDDFEDGVVDGIERFMSTIANEDDDDYYGSTPDYAEEHSANGVADLLVEQTEVADVVLINKIDIPSSESSSTSSSSPSSKLDRIESIVRAFNPRAKTYRTKFGIVDRLENVLAAAGGRGVVDAGVVDDHRDAVEAASALTQSHGTTDLRNDDNSIDDSHHLQQDHHSHDHQSHDHHSHDHHSHDHHSHENDKDEITTKHPPSSSSSSCTDPNCTDPTHSHTHSHSHASHDSQTFSGIGTFVYRERRPFHPKRLLSVLHMLPVKRGLPNSSMTASKDGEDPSIDEEEQAKRRDAFKRIIRSKGFTWLADSHLAAMYWSHAGSSFEMQCLGRWWATLPREQWPEEAIEAILSDFDCVDHDEQNSSLSSSSTSSPIQSVGDRRQEIVLIGPGLSNPTNQGVICKALDECLLTDDEWKLYSQNCRDEQSLRETFVNSLSSRMIAY